MGVLTYFFHGWGQVGHFELNVVWQTGELPHRSHGGGRLEVHGLHLGKVAHLLRHVDEGRSRVARGHSAKSFSCQSLHI